MVWDCSSVCRLMAPASHCLDIHLRSERIPRLLQTCPIYVTKIIADVNICFKCIKTKINTIFVHCFFGTYHYLVYGHDDVIKSKPFSALLAPLWVDSPHKSQWRVTFMFSMICAWINGWANSGATDDLRRHWIFRIRVQYCLHAANGTRILSTFSSVSWHKTIHKTYYAGRGFLRATDLNGNQ